MSLSTLLTSYGSTDPSGKLQVELPVPIQCTDTNNNDTCGTLPDDERRMMIFGTDRMVSTGSLLLGVPLTVVSRF